MVIDRFLPRYDVTEVHSIDIAASPDRVWETLRHGDIGGSWIIKGLMGLRTIFSLTLRRRRDPITIETMTRHGFGILEEETGSELVLGVTGRFWRPTGNLLPFDRASFDGDVPPGVARGLWNFVVEPSARGVRLTTETRVLCGDAASRRKFRAYWTFVRPFSGLIRIIMLRSIRRASE